MNPKVSILMSIYNENESEVFKSINSLVAQTYPNIEIIIIVDNPLGKERYAEMLGPYEDNNKIIVSYNERNIGLARSMNAAFDLSTGDYIARMDADDISLHDRIEKQVTIIKEQQADLVCTGYKFIDEMGREIEGEYIFYPPADLKKSLLTTNSIHHPTILMTKEIFIKSGGYRDFPYSQDYDLWLRLLDVDCKFYMIDEVLLLYRVRADSTTNRKRFEQACTNFYISNLLYQRLTTDADDYSKENYAAFIRECSAKYSTYKKDIVSIQKMQKRIGHGVLVTIITRIRLLISSDFVRDTYFLKLKIKSEARKFYDADGQRRKRSARG
ncbi:MAG: glycosyltransferase [Gammaproteobacteria bacterium]|nr:glycosyltransferase [Gammaproteobacteria bacterium]